MPRCYIVKKPIQQYSNFTILKSSAASIMASAAENGKTTTTTTTISTNENTTGPISPTEASVAPTCYNNTLENQSRSKYNPTLFFCFVLVFANFILQPSFSYLVCVNLSINIKSNKESPNQKCIYLINWLFMLAVA